MDEVNRDLSSRVDHKELNIFFQHLTDTLQGAMSEEDFTAHRLQQGVYGQRQAGEYMVRVKLPAGSINIHQLQKVGELLENYAQVDFVNLTTRQDIQFHSVKLGNIESVLSGLAEVNLTTREACGNTVRNVTACPYAGACDKELVDVQRVVDDVVNNTMRHPLMQYLPRKMKISVSGCEQDCAVGMIHDIGIVAVRKDNVLGFKVRAGGGLGHKPRESIVLEEFVTQEKLIPVLQSVIFLHNQYSDRHKRAKSRLKFLVEKFGEEGFKLKYSEQLAKTEARRAVESRVIEPDSAKRWHSLDPVNNSVEIRFDKGDVTSEAIRNLTTLLAPYKNTTFTVLQNQNLLVKTTGNVARLKDNLQSAGFLIQGGEPKCVACPGTWTCRLGITASRDMLDRVNSFGLKVNVSGCHNACAQPHLADVGLHGEARRKFGTLIPYYQMHLGAKLDGQGEFALKGPEIPASRVVNAIKVLSDTYNADKTGVETFAQWVRRKGIVTINDLLRPYTSVEQYQIETLAKDVGESQSFKVAQLGGGECAGVAQESLSAKFAEIDYENRFRKTFLLRKDFESAADCYKKILELSAEVIFSAHRKRTMGDLLTKLSVLESLETENTLIPYLTSALRDLLDMLHIEAVDVRIETHEKLDAWLVLLRTKYQTAIVRPTQPSPEKTYDLRGLIEPIQLLKAKQRLATLKPGEQVIFLAEGEPAESIVFTGLKKLGYSIHPDVNSGGVATVKVVKPVGLTQHSGRQHADVRKDKELI